MLPGQSCGLAPEFFGQSGTLAVLAAPLIESLRRCRQGNGKVRWLFCAHQSFSRKFGFAGPPDDPSHRPPIKRNLPATTDDTSEIESFHTALPKGHELFVKRPGRALTRDEILNVVWGYDCFVGPRSIDRFITTLRNKIEPDPHNPTFIHTMIEIGYKFELPDMQKQEQ